MARVNLYEDLYDGLINDRGNRCLWQRACVCSCVDRKTGQPDFSCNRCNGSGYVYMAPKEIIVAVTSLNSNYRQSMLEIYEPGTAYITPKADVIMGYKDRLRFPDFKCLFSEVVRFTEKTNISNRTYRNVIESVYAQDKDYSFEEGTDFKITEDRHHLEWINTEITGVHQMGFLYYTTPSYIVEDLLHELRATRTDRYTEGTGIRFAELPKQYRCRREDFVYGVNDKVADAQDPEPLVRPPEAPKPWQPVVGDENGTISI